MTNTGYDLSRDFFNWCFENPEKISPNHAALYFFCIEHCNRLGWKEKFGLPTVMAKEAIGIKNYKTYINTLNDLIDFGFIKMVQKSTNQWSSNIIALVKNTNAHSKALSKATLKHTLKQTHLIDSVDKPITINQEPTTIDFNIFWELYNNKTGRKKCEAKWGRLKITTQELIIKTLPDFLAYKPFESYNHPNPETYLNNERWNDVIPKKKEITTYNYPQPNMTGE